MQRWHPIRFAGIMHAMHAPVEDVAPILLSVLGVEVCIC